MGYDGAPRWGSQIYTPQIREIDEKYSTQYLTALFTRDARILYYVYEWHPETSLASAYFIAPAVQVPLYREH